MPLETSALRRLVRFGLLVGVPALGLTVAGAIYLAGGRSVGTDNAYVRSGILAVAAEVPGPVVEVAVLENQRVEQGQLLFRVAPEPFRIALSRAEADLARARTDVEVLKASYRRKREEIQLAETKLDFADREARRLADLAQKSIVSQTANDQARHAAAVARQEIAVLRQEALQIAANLGGNPEAPTERHALVLEAASRRDQAALDLARTEVKAPFPGIAAKTPELGAYVRAGMPAMSLVGTSRLWVEANLKETDLAHVRPGQRVRIVVDTFAEREWVGRVESIAQATGSEFSVLPAQNATGNWVKVVQRVPVRIALDNGAADPVLRSGMSVIVEIETGQGRALPPPVRAALAGVGLLAPGAETK
jgi:membrane fusion protein (multidrug efflux system)